MARKGGKSKGKNGRDISYGQAAKAPGARINKMESHEDTLQEGGVDDFMFKRDQIMFNPQDESEDEDVNGEVGEAVMGIDVPSEDEGEGDYDDEEEEYDQAPKKKARMEKVKADVSTKGRFGKPIESSDEEDEDSASGTEEEEEEGWGRQYYSRPSTRREKEDSQEYDEQREEVKEMEEKEVRRLQKKARQVISAAEDWGLDEVSADPVKVAKASDEEEQEAPRPSVPAPQTTDRASLIGYLEIHDPLKIALARDFHLVVDKIRKTAKGIEAVMMEQEGEESLHKGLGWLHYQTLLTYASTLAFYLHLAALPAEERPDFTTHPILPRLLQLKEGLGMLEDLDFAAGDNSDIDPLENNDITDEMHKELAAMTDEEFESLKAKAAEEKLLKDAKKELFARMMSTGGPGAAGVDEDDFYDEDEDMMDLWSKAGLDEDELRDLLADAADDLEEEPASVPTKKSQKKTGGKASKKDKKNKSKAIEQETLDGDEDEDPLALSQSFTPLQEPTFVSSKKSKPKAASRSDDIHGDPTVLDDADATDKERRKRSLQFHTAKIASTSARREAARAQRMSGDDDLPYRDRQAARDAALRKNSAAAAKNGGADLDGSEFSETDKKRAREVREEQGSGSEGGDDGEDYYDLVKRRKTDKQAAKAAAHEEFQKQKLAEWEDDTHEGGPRALTRAIEKNRGLTPRRSKAGRNPRVKKRQAYEKAKQKVGSQRAVYKGGQAALGGSYAGEKTGISTVVKSRKF